MYCEHCLGPITRPLPVEPVFAWDVVLYLAPCRPQALKSFLRRRKVDFPRRYIVTVGPKGKTDKRRVRVFTASEVRAIREHFVRMD